MLQTVCIMDKKTNFSIAKLNALKKVDFSNKGSFDKPILDLIQLINNEKALYTTSSCSGRITLVSCPMEDGSTKKNLKWLLNSHDVVDIEEVLLALEKATESFKIKFEPFILHVKCETVKDAQLLQKAAFSSGFKNSGITFGHRGKHIMCAVRAPSSIDVPLTDNKGNKMVSDEYISYIVNISNQKMVENFGKIKRFEATLIKCIDELKNDQTSTKKLKKKEKKDGFKKKYNCSTTEKIQKNTNKVDECLDDFQFLFA